MLIKSNQLYLLSTFNKKVIGWGEILCFMYFFVMPVYTSNSDSKQIAENMQQRPLGSHFSVGRRIPCNTGTTLLLLQYYEYTASGPPTSLPLPQKVKTCNGGYLVVARQIQQNVNSDRF